MLVVMLFMLVATAAAVVSIRATQNELEAAGQERVMRQTRAASEAAMTTTIAWIDMLGDSGKWVDVWDEWMSAAAPPPMNFFGEPPIQNNARHMAGRTYSFQQNGPRKAGEHYPLSSADATDPIGSFGPNQAYTLPFDAATFNPRRDMDMYAVDITDCALAPSSSSPGAPLSGGSESVSVVQFYCVLTAHVSMRMAGNTATNDWTIGTATYSQPRYAVLNDSRATILTPQMLVTR